MIAELADGRILEFPDGTDPAVIQATVKSLTNPPSNAAVGVNAANKGLAGIPDALLNTPTNAINLVKAAVGTPLAAMGRPDLAPEPSSPPNYATRAMKAMGFIRDKANPQTPPQRFIDSAVQGSVGALGGPANSGKQAVINALMGASGGTVSQGVKESGGSDNAALAAGMMTQFAPAAAQRAIAGKPVAMTDVKAQTLKESRDADYVVPGSETNTGVINKIIESFAGKAATKQAASLKNQKTTTQNIGDELGIDPNSITPGAISSRKYDVSEPYREIAALSPAASKNIEMLKQVRAEANLQYDHYRVSKQPEALKKAEGLMNQANLIESVLEQIAARRGRAGLVDEYRDARTQIAKLSDSERALNKATGDISAPDLGRLVDKGKPVTGAIATAGRFAEAFPRYATEAAGVPPPDVSKLNAVASTLLGTAGGNVGFQAGGLPGMAVGLSAAGLPYLAGPARSMILSKKYQDFLQNSGNPPTEAQIRALLVARALAEQK